MNPRFLPLGSVVLLNGGKKKLMITGYAVSTPDYPDHIFDYCGCLYPEGTIRSDTISVFNHSEIKQILFKGYLDIEEKEYLEKLKSIYHKPIDK